MVLGGVGSLLATNWWVRRQAGPHLFDEAAEVPQHTVAIVPGARVHRDGRPYPVLVDRLEAARRLYETGQVRRILVSGDHAHKGYDEPNGMRRWLLARGVSSEDVFMDHAGLRTLDTMQRAARVFEVRDAVVCTQRFHLARSVFLARHAGIDAVGLVADRRTYGDPRYNAAREMLARTRAFADVYVLGAQPRHLGDPIPIDGSARATHDRMTRR